MCININIKIEANESLCYKKGRNYINNRGDQEYSWVNG